MAQKIKVFRGFALMMRGKLCTDFTDTYDNEFFFIHPTYKDAKKALDTLMPINPKWGIFEVIISPRLTNKQ